MPNPDGTPTALELLAGASGAGTNSIPNGTTKTFGGYVYQWDGTRWYNTGVLDQSNSNGLSFDQQMALATAPRISSSSSVSSEDPAQFAAKLAQSADQFNQQMNMQIQKNSQDSFLQQQIQAFNQTKEQFAESQSDRQLALQAQQQQQDAAMKIATLQQQQSQMQANRDQFNAQMQFQVAQANAAFQSAAADRAAQAARDVANFAGNPTDYGKLAAYLTAHPSFGGAATNLQGQNFTSPTSIAPLGQALQAGQTATQQEHMSPYTFTPLAPLPGVDTSGISAPAPVSSASSPNVQQQTLKNIDTGQGNTAFTDAFVNGNQNAVGALLAQGFTPANTTSNTPAMAKGGMVDGAYIGDEQGSELHIPLAPGKALVINHEQLKKMNPSQLKSLKKLADGGVFSGGNVMDFSVTDPQQFLDQATQKALSMTPWGGAGISGLPSPVFAATPGISPLVTQLIGGIGQTAGLLPADEYARQADVLSPVAYTRMPIARQIPVARTA